MEDFCYAGINIGVPFSSVRFVFKFNFTISKEFEFDKSSIHENLHGHTF